jgi:hypothetical protein
MLLGRVRISLWQKAPRSIKRCRLSRGAIRVRILAGANARGDIQPREQSHRQPRVPEAQRGGHVRNRSRTRLAFSRALRPATCFVQVVARWSRRGNASKANATGIGWCRQLACEDRAAHLGVPARRIQGCRKSASVAEAPEKRVPGGNGAREREPGQRVRKGQLVKRRRQPGSRWPNRASGEGSSQGARKGIAGQRSLSNGRHLGPLSHRYRFTRPVGVGLGGDCHGNERVSAKGRGGRRDRGVRSASAHMARGRQRPRHEEKPTVRSAEASLSGVNQEVPRQARASSP